MAFKQANRLLKISTPLGEDAVHLLVFRGNEEISRPFLFQIDLISMDPAINPVDIVGKNVTISIDFPDESKRFFNGFVSRFGAGNEDAKGRRSYYAEVVPWLWFLSQTNDCRIFQDKTVTEIIEQIFGDLGFQEFEISQIKGSHPKREYCVQYRESDFDFVSRLMEEEGIFFFFRHENGKHVMVLADQKGVYADCKEKLVDFFGSVHETASFEPQIKSWGHTYDFRPGKFSHTDYNFKTPKTKLLVTEKTLMKIPSVDKFEVYDYPGEFDDKAVGTALARMRMEEMEVSHDTVTGTSDCMSFSPALRFKIRQHVSKAEEGKSYVLKRVCYRASEPDYETTSESVEKFSFDNQFECYPESATFRPARTTPKPLMRGCQTAVITGPPGEEIYTDEFGRVKGQFHWDREGKYDDKSSCWMLVSQPHAGKGWGYMDLPRIGEEVIVDFLEGDPDKPVIVGRLYNGENKPPFNLPAEKTRRGNKTKTYKGKGFNEMSMDDTPGKEQINIHAQYNMNTVVENDSTIQIKTGKHTFDVDTGTASYTVKGAVTETFKATQSTTVQDSIDIKTNASFIHVQSPTEIKLTVGSSTVTLTPDTIKLKSPNIVFEATTKIDGSAPDIKFVASTEAKVSAPTVSISGGKVAEIGVGNQTVKCDTSQVGISGAAISSSATGKHDITGAMVKIN